MEDSPRSIDLRFEDKIRFNYYQDSDNHQSWIITS